MEAVVQKVLDRLPPSTKECRVWPGATNGHGYGKVRCPDRRRALYVHRVVLAEHLGVDVDSLDTVDHLCRNPSCANPFHLEEVTHAENCQRGTLGSVSAARAAAQTHCKNGHAFDEANTRYYTTSKGYIGRKCRACEAERMRKYRSSRKDLP